MATKPVLYSYWRSSCSWRVRAVLALKQIPYECKPINLINNGGEQHVNEYKLINPAQMVPSLIIDGNTITQSLAIIEYLEEEFSSPPLLPKNAVEKAKVRALSLLIAADIQPIQNLGVLNYIGENKVQFAKHFIEKGFQVLEAMLKSTAGKFSYGDEITIADCCLVPQVYNALRFKVDMNQFPIIKRINDTLMELDAFKSTHPSRQPDTPSEERQQ